MVAVLSPSALPSIRFTVDEYLHADLPDGQRYELVNGAVQMTPAPNRLHDEPLDALQEHLYAYRQEHPGAFRHLSQRAGVPIPGRETVREPDLALYSQWERERGSLGAWDDVTPFWVAEVVSPGQERRDYEDKREDYLLAGIREYWIIDPQRRCVTVLVRGDKDWTEAVCSEDQTAVSRALPGFAVSVVSIITAAR